MPKTKRKSHLSKSRNAKIARINESLEEKEMRLIKAADYQKNKRQKETQDEYEIRISKAADYEKNKCQKETQDEYEIRISKAADYEKNKRQKETQDEYKIRISKATDYEKNKRQNETQDEYENRISKAADYKKNKRQNETQDEYENRLSKAADYEKNKRQNETQANYQERSSKDANYRKNIRENETEEQRSNRLSKAAMFVKNKRDVNPRIQYLRSLLNDIYAAEITDIENLSHKELNSLKQYGLRFDGFQKSLKLVTCEVCFEKTMEQIPKQICNRCKKVNEKKKNPESNCVNKFTAENRMDPGVQPIELSGLSFIEEQLIAKVHPVMTVYKIRGQQYGYSSHIINFPQNVQRIADQLPYDVSDLDNIVLIRKANSKGHHDFHVRRNIVRKALMFLKEYNIYYRDIEINEENLMKLPVDGNVTKNISLTTADQDTNNENMLKIVEENFADLLIVNQNDDITIEEEIQNITITSDAPVLLTKEERKKITLGLEDTSSTVLQWPPIEKEAINEFETDGYIAMTFPTLFPYGEADLRQTRLETVTPSEYFQHLINYKDERFAKNPRFRFFALNSMMRWTALQNGTIFVRRNEIKNIRVEDLKMKLEKEPGFLKKMMAYNANIRGTSSYWYTRCGELLNMVRMLGQPTMFFTLSAADLYWPELCELLAPGKSFETEKEEIKFKNNLLNENPLMFANFFHQRVVFFVKHIMNVKFKVSDFWYRTEFQHRGSPHVHGLIWLENAPTFDLDKCDPLEIQNIANYFDKLISSINPNVDNDKHVGKHPCTIHLTDVSEEDIDDDYNRLINWCQRHTKHGYHCLRRSKKTRVKECRFHFPKDLSETTKIEKVDGRWKLLTRRNDPLLNSHNRFILQLWRGNIDLQPVLSLAAVLNYVAKYASKGEDSSENFLSILSNVLKRGCEVQNAATTVVQKIFMKLCDRDYSAQESFHLVMGWPLFHASREFVTISIEKDDMVNVKYTKEIPAITTYKERPTELEDLNLHDFYSWYYKKQGDLKKRNKQAVVQIKPHVPFSHFRREDYYRQRILSYSHYRDEKDVKYEYESWEDAYIRLNMIDNELFPTHENDEYDEMSDNERNEYNDRETREWMIIARDDGMGAIITLLGTRDIDIYHDWSESYANYTDPLTLKNFVEEAKKQQTDSEKSSEGISQSITVILSDEQEEVMKLINDQISCLENHETRRIIVQGKAGTGKSMLITNIKKELRRRLGNKSFILAAPTGAAALNIKAQTVHSAFRIGIDRGKKMYQDLKGDSLKNFQMEYQNVRFVLLDEMSMIGCSLLRKIDLRCRQLKPNQSSLPFGNMFVYMFGDFRQLPPVMDRAFYSKSYTGEIYDKGQLVFHSFQKYYHLRTTFRQRDKVFIDILDRLADGENTTDDYYKLIHRNVVKKDFDDSIRLFPTNDSVNKYNLKKLEKLNQPVARIAAKNHPALAVKATTDIAQGLENDIYLSIGSRVMLRVNLWTKKGLVNGSLGTVTDIIFKPDERPPNDFPLVVFVKFDNYQGPTYEDSGAIPIPPLMKQWKDGTTKCSRTQFPLLLSWAVTIHKSQGLTLSSAVIDIGRKEFTIGSTYVALSRVKTLDSLIFQPLFNFDRISKLKTHKLLQERKGMEQWLNSLNESANDHISSIICEINRPEKNAENREEVNTRYIPTNNNNVADIDSDRLIVDNNATNIDLWITSDELNTFAYNKIRNMNQSDIYYIDVYVTNIIRMASNMEEYKVHLDLERLNAATIILAFVNDSVDYNDKGAHWSLLCYNKNERIFKHADSIISLNGTNRHRNQARVIANRLTAILTDIDVASIINVNNGIQNNNEDCGVYSALSFSNFIGNNVYAVPFATEDKSDMRTILRPINE